MVRDVVYFGRNRPEGGTVSDEEWQAFLNEVVAPRFPAGLTIVDAVGQWQGESGVVEQERSQIVTLLHDGGAASRASVARWRRNTSAASIRRPCFASACRRARASSRRARADHGGYRAAQSSNPAGRRGRHPGDRRPPGPHVPGDGAASRPACRATRVAAAKALGEMIARDEYIGWLASPAAPPGPHRGGAGVQRRRALPHPVAGAAAIRIAESRHAIVLNVYTEPTGAGAGWGSG
jgi:hypothetical protein